MAILIFTFSLNDDDSVFQSNMKSHFDIWYCKSVIQILTMKLVYILQVVFIFICLTGTGFAQSTKDESSGDTSTGKDVSSSTANPESNPEDEITGEPTTPESITNSTSNVTNTDAVDPVQKNDHTVVIVVSVIGGILAIGCVIFALKYFQICQWKMK